jgi:hypothetical protein
MRYAADRAFRQYDATDPANRLVAAELELRWNQALTRVGEIETRIAAHETATAPQSDLSTASFATLADDLGTVWKAPTTDARLKKRIVRAVIMEVVADIDAEAGKVVLILHWMGGVHTELHLPRRRRGQRNSTSQDILAAVRQLVLIANDELIAGILNRNKLTTGHGNRWTRERVTALRSHHKIPVYCPAEEGHEPWLNLSKAAAHLLISPKTLRLAAECREIDALHPLPEGPWVFSRTVLDSTAAKALSPRLVGTEHGILEGRSGRLDCDDRLHQFRPSIGDQPAERARLRMGQDDRRTDAIEQRGHRLLAEPLSLCVIG